ncbi:MAG TPA: transketolase C-terminal domain-containing protein [Alphaproteobacteria bacterium]|nr:transketolase C-terminal domain-containing protein [Alphaproteobacteria bacterium]
MRNAFAEEITSLGIADSRIVLLSGDIGNKLFDRFKAHNESRFYNCGVAEANMMSMAAGLGLSGLRPVVYTITPFTTTRCYEQIRVDVCYHRAPVVIVGTGAGLSYAELGPTHHSCEDLAILRLLPEMTVLAPCDAVELRLALRAALRQDGPVYMRIGKKGEPILHATEPDFAIGRAITLRNGADLCLIATGTIMSVVLAAADRLAAAGLSVRVESFPTVKPLDRSRLDEVFASFPLLGVVEEHGLAGGLGGSIAEWLARRADFKGRLVTFGTPDEFMHEVGSQDYARQRFGLSSENIAATMLRHWRAR